MSLLFNDVSDGTKAKEVEENVKTYDVAELLEKSVFGEEEEVASKIKLH